MKREKILDWLRDRHANCIRIASNKSKDDRAGWLEDASYFEAAIEEIEQMEALLASPPEPTDNETKCPTCEGTGVVDFGGFTPWGEGIDIKCGNCHGTGKDQRESVPESDSYDQRRAEWIEEHAPVTVDLWDRLLG